ncbi:2,3,4,5-tetrahydropyridine-2,6-dicarboxylate N-acetyltransferase [Romboutsia sp. 1001713B170207_170306_H8]|uniref:2,3,4,5-tetrahydropyridine-2,6-dicarboxylate N-acetyltransferase n=1 Tax=Romboutsia sp. 1001713B170207_170306_H8 TaxID=2787112 RepID=UPI0008214BA4|nr:2,3,4,5-tetrahydropyridine-2,6-dicarboxylate N-acetyltransferase [Romboutsia sp. 1001713B170207_170306_H8]SCI19429.1 2%2C3%2C4%2C5-tetrahydropyridine-2%2C6-dicarboxy late N-acetyltransferase [uncultured Clostridium sp.]
MINLNDAYEIARFIKDSEKQTPVKIYITGKLLRLKRNDKFKVFGGNGSYTLIGDYNVIMNELESVKNHIDDIHIEYDRRNSAIPMYNYLHEEARIEPGALIRDMVTIGKNAVIMMGAVVNIGAVIGEGSMVDMNAVIGARGIIGKNVHLGACSVVAGVLEPPSATPVVIEDDVVIGANCVILEGVRVGKGAVVAAGSVVTKDVEPNTVVAGSPAKLLKFKDEKTSSKTQILSDLRKLD